MDSLVKKRRVAVIPARGGSKRIPNKNVKLFGNKPMLAWTIEAAQATQLFDRVFVSTDSQAIADIACLYGCEVPFLRDQFADDYATASEVTCYALQQLESQLQETYDIVVQLMPNCPLRTAASILNSLNNFEINDFLFQISCFKFGWNNPWWAFTMDEQLRGTKLFPDMLQKRSQDLPALYCPTGAIWIANVNALLREKNFYGADHRFFSIPWEEAIDIDTIEDWHVAEKMNSSIILPTAEAV